jgi:type II secretory pathway component GspD/PulD (secretin)
VVGGGCGNTGGNNTQQAEPVRSNRSVSVIPGRNILVVRATDEEIALINEIIAMADRPPFQIIIKGLVYTANIDRLTDIGVQTNIIASTADGRTSGSILGNPIGGAGTLFDFSTLIGTVDFNIQASALQRNGIISIKSRPFAIVLDGDSTELEVGRQIPVLTQGSVVGDAPGDVQFIGATSKLDVTPQVIDDEQGNPMAVNLQLQLQSNEVDTTIISQDLPAINERKINTRIILSQDKTVILGGFTVDSTNDSVSKTPGLGDIPILGYLFKRKVRQDQVNRLYFALSVSIVRYGDVIEPVNVPGATTDIPGVKPSVIRKEENLKKKDQ